MTDKMYILLDQTLFFIQGIQITFIYYYEMKPRRAGRIITGYFYAVFGIVLDCIILAVVDNTEIRQNKETELAELENLRKRELQYIEYDRHRREEIYSIRHELGNQLQMLELLLETETDRGKINLVVKQIRNKLIGAVKK